MPIELLPSGLKIQSAIEILEEKKASIKSKFGDDYDTTEDNPIIPIVSIDAEREALLQEAIQALHLAQYPDSAEDKNLDSARSLTGQKRLKGLPTKVTHVKLATTGVNPVIIPSGSLVKQTSTGIVFQTISEVTIPASSFVLTEVWSVDNGDFSVSAGSINYIVTPINGWDSVENMNTGVVTAGRVTEDDATFKRRSEINLVISRGGNITAMKNRIREEVAGIKYVTARENRTSVIDGNGLPPKSFEIIVLGATDEDVVKKIVETEPAGIGSYGSSSHTVTDSEGNAQTRFFSRVTEKLVYMIINITTDSNYPSNGDETIKKLMVDYGKTLLNGNDVTTWKLQGLLIGIPGITDTPEILIGFAPTPTLSDNLTIAETEIAVIEEANIIVNS